MPAGKGYSAEIIKANSAPAGNTLPDDVEELMNLAMDPMYDTPDPTDIGALQSGVTSGAPVLDYRSQPSYAEGGVVGPGGQPIRPDAGLNVSPQQGITPEVMQQEVRRIVQEHPEQVMQLRQAVMQAVQSGDLTPQELDMIAQLTVAAAQNPEVYPQIRQFAIQQGLATEQDLPVEYDPGLVFILMLIVQAAQQQIGGQPMAAGGQPRSAGQPSAGNFKGGGDLPNQSPNPDGSIKINAHEGERVMTRAANEYYGRKFFDKLEREAQEATGGNGQDGA